VLQEELPLRVWEVKIIKAISIIFAIFILFVISGEGLKYFRLEYILSVGVAFIYLLGFLFFPVGDHEKTRNLMFDWFLGILGFGIAVYALIPSYYIHETPRFILQIPIYEVVFGVLSIILLLELVRRTAGKILTVILVLFLVYAFLGDRLPMVWVHEPLDFQWFISFMYLGNIYYGATEGIFGRLTVLVITIISGFLIFAGVMMAVGLGKFIIDVFQSLTGWMSGGPAKVSIWASALFGMITGSPVAEVMAVGSVTIPAMISVGFQRHIAAAIEAAAGCGGELMPPIMGAGAFIMSELIGVPYIKIALAAVLPAILYFFTKFTAIHYYAKANGLVGLPRDQLPKLREVLKDRWLLLIPLVVLLILLPTLPSVMWAAFWSVITALIVPNLRKTTRVDKTILIDNIVDSVKSLVTIGAIIIAADIAATVMAITGLSVSISNLMIALAGGNNLIALIIAMVGALLLGMLVPATAAYIFAAVTFANPLISLGFDPLPTHLFLFYFAIMGPITPPVALATFAACGIAKADFWKAGVWGVVFALTGFIAPFVFIYDSSLLLIGNPLSTILRFVCVAVGSTTLASVIFGYFYKKLTIVERFILLAASALLLYPDNSYLLNTIGGIMLGLVFIVYRIHIKRYKEAKEEI